MVVSLQGRSDTLTAFLNPSRAVAKTVMQTVGELDFETIFNDGNLLYSPSAYLLLWWSCQFSSATYWCVHRVLCILLHMLG